LLVLLSAAALDPALADPERVSRSDRSSITCDTIRAYVARVGVSRARAIARANGMTREQERQARQCLSNAG
jgi:hypothetical protein